MELRGGLACVFSLLSLIFASVMIAGTSDDCDIVKNVAWATRPPINTYYGDATLVYLGTDMSCLLVSGKLHHTIFHGKYSHVLGYEGCDESGHVAAALTDTVFVFVFIFFGVTLARVKKVNFSDGILKAGALLLAQFAIIFDIAAMSHFENKCLSDINGSEPYVGIVLGSIMVFTLAIGFGLHLLF